MSRNEKLLCFFSLFFGTILRILVSRIGYNYDFESYQVVVEASAQGLTPWQTNRYNYGPIWFNILKIFDWINQNTHIDFRLQIILFLSAVDLLISFFIFKVRNFYLACAFFLNPISIVTSGYHNQFDNFSIALMCLAIFTLRQQNTKFSGRSDLLALLLMGLSLATKHIFIFFIPWIAIREKTIARKSLFFVVPYFIFSLTFLPYVGSSWDAIFTNVISYRSLKNMPFWNLVGVDSFGGILGASSMFAVLMLIGCFLVRKVTLTDALFVYCVVVVAISPSIANQYLAIAAFGSVGLMNLVFIFFYLYSIFWIKVTTLFIVRFSFKWIDFLLGFGLKPIPILLILGICWHYIKVRFGKSKAI